jgi:hypothetical protein
MCARFQRRARRPQPAGHRPRGPAGAQLPVGRRDVELDQDVAALAVEAHATAAGAQPPGQELRQVGAQLRRGRPHRQAHVLAGGRHPRSQRFGERVEAAARRAAAQDHERQRERPTEDPHGHATRAS